MQKLAWFILFLILFSGCKGSSGPSSGDSSATPAASTSASTNINNNQNYVEQNQIISTPTTTDTTQTTTAPVVAVSGGITNQVATTTTAPVPAPIVTTAPEVTVTPAPVATTAATSTVTATPEVTATSTPTPTPTPIATAAPVVAPTPVPVATTAATPTVTATPEVTATPTSTSTPIATATPVVTPTPVATAAPVVTPTPTPAPALAPILATIPLPIEITAPTPILLAQAQAPTPVEVKASIPTPVPTIANAPVTAPVEVAPAPAPTLAPSPIPAPAEIVATAPVEKVAPEVDHKSSDDSDDKNEPKKDDKLPERLVAEEKKAPLNCAFAALPAGSTMKTSDDKTLSISCAEGDDLAYNWSFDGRPLKVDVSSLKVSQLSVGDHVYEVSIRNSRGESSAKMSLTVLSEIKDPNKDPGKGNLWMPPLLADGKTINDGSLIVADGGYSGDEEIYTPGCLMSSKNVDRSLCSQNSFITGILYGNKESYTLTHDKNKIVAIRYLTQKNLESSLIKLFNNDEKSISNNVMISISTKPGDFSVNANCVSVSKKNPQLLLGKNHCEVQGNTNYYINLKILDDCILNSKKQSSCRFKIKMNN